MVDEPELSSDEPNSENANVKSSFNLKPASSGSGKAEVSDLTPDGEVPDQQSNLHKKGETLRWPLYIIALIGLWLIATFFLPSFFYPVVMPGGGRLLWLNDDLRVTLTAWSNLICGIALFTIAVYIALSGHTNKLWLSFLPGIWLNAAPLFFWAPTAFIFYNDTLTGLLVIGLPLIQTGLPLIIHKSSNETDIPEGWSYNPALWKKRKVMILICIAGFIVARYMSAFQLGYFAHLGGPLPLSGERVLNSQLSQSLPVSDAGLGSLAYLLEFILGCTGNSSRWKTMPWLIAFMGLLVVPVGFVEISLVIAQPLIVGAWCILCLAIAAIMVPLIPIELDEVIAMIQVMKQAKVNGDSRWSAFWKGYTAGNPQKKSTKSMNDNSYNAASSFSLRGISVPWTLLVSAITGLVIMILPDLLQIPMHFTMANVNHLCGALIITVAVISMGEVARSFRKVNMLLGITICIFCFILLIPNTKYLFGIIDLLAGLLVIILSIPKGIIKESYGSWNKHIR